MLDKASDKSSSCFCGGDTSGDVELKNFEADE